MLSINEKINYEDKGEFLVISLNEDGFKRYMEVFTEFFPEFKKELLGAKQ